MIDEFSNLYDRMKTSEDEVSTIWNLRALIEEQSELRFLLVIQSAAVHGMYQSRLWGAGLLEIARMFPLRALDLGAAGDLLGQRAKMIGLSFPKEISERIVELTGGNPYLLNVICYEIVECLRDTAEQTVLRSHMEAAIERGLQHQAGIHFEHLCELIQGDTEWAIVEELARAESLEGGASKNVEQLLRLEDQTRSSELVLAGLGSLAEKGILVAGSGSQGKITYKIGIPLFARWLRSNRLQVEKEQ
jgi:hypothetical protein